MCVMGGSLGDVIFPPFATLLRIYPEIAGSRQADPRYPYGHCGGFPVEEEKMPAAPAAEQKA